MIDKFLLGKCCSNFHLSRLISSSGRLAVAGRELSSAYHHHLLTQLFTGALEETDEAEAEAGGEV